MIDEIKKEFERLVEEYCESIPSTHFNNWLCRSYRLQDTGITIERYESSDVEEKLYYLTPTGETFTVTLYGSSNGYESLESIWDVVKAKFHLELKKKKIIGNYDGKPYNHVVNY